MAKRDLRPGAAVGHVFLGASDIPVAVRWFEEAGLRAIVDGDDFAVLELRGGTHLVITRRRRAPRKGTEAPFDLMVDDVDAVHDRFAKRGLKPSRIRRGSIHDSFHVAGPDGYAVTVVSSHAGNRPV
jgi:Glyoxalase/Bleomycin resistance protein/Dioxygenase superfamily